jgi:hypothetical protein
MVTTRASLMIDPSSASALEENEKLRVPEVLGGGEDGPLYRPYVDNRSEIYNFLKQRSEARAGITIRNGVSKFKSSARAQGQCLYELDDGDVKRSQD